MLSSNLVENQNSTGVKHYRMTRVTYGIVSSAFHSIRPLEALAEKSDDESFRIEHSSTCTYRLFYQDLHILNQQLNFATNLSVHLLQLDLKIANGHQMTRI